MPQSIEQLVQEIAAFPGIGPRQARRIVQFLLSKNPQYLEKLADDIRTIRAHTVQCESCFRYDEAGSGTLCRICADKNRDDTILMLVEKDVDIEGVESSQAYHGRYFVLGGLMSMVQRKTPRVVRTNELFTRLKNDAVAEVILALATTPEGDFTAREVVKELRTRFPTVQATLLGRGLSVGAEIEYADTETLRNALKNRA